MSTSGLLKKTEVRAFEAVIFAENSSETPTFQTDYTAQHPKRLSIGFSSKYETKFHTN